MRRLMVMVMLLAFIPTSYPLPGKLGDFKKGAEKEENGNKKNISGSSSSSYDDSDSDTEGGACVGAMCSFAGQILSALWALHNFSLCYARFPYDAKNNGSFVNYAAITNMDNADVDSVPAWDVPPGDKQDVLVPGAARTAEKRPALVPSGNPPGTRSWYYTMESAGQYAFDEGGAYAARVSGKFWRFIGPEFSARVFFDGDDTLIMYHPGVNISLFQHNYCAADSYVQASIMRGILNRNGIVYGLVLSSYPVKPVTLMFRAGGIHYEYIDFWDLEGRVGMIFGRVEVFAGYQHIQAKYAGLGGPLAGVRVFL